MPQDVAPPLAAGRYRLVEEIGVGTKADVYRAIDTRTAAVRGVKILAPALAAKPASRIRFEKGGRAMAALNETHIVKVFDVGTDGDRVYIVMELMSGGKLQKRLNDAGPYAPRAACEVTLGLLGGLQAAHSAGVVHRNVNPDNILLAGDGTAKLSDFDLAHVEEGSDDARLTMHGVFIGAWAYTAPEQRRDARLADARSDVYAVGATFYTLLTNKRPQDLYLAEFQDNLLDAIPMALRGVISSATRYKPDDRYPSAGAMAAELQIAMAALG